MNRQTGDYQRFGELEHFTPAQLPPVPALEMDGETIDLFGRAMQELGRVDEMLHRLPDSKRFLRAYVTKEALLSSEIEGIHTTLTHVFGYNKTGKTSRDKNVRLVVNYVKALDRGIAMIREENLPIVSRMICECHRVLLSGTEDDGATPGSYRIGSVRVGQLIPPPAQKVKDLIANLEKFINADNSLPPLVKAGIAHVQFETIHPFFDGNGRIGRLLIVLMLIQERLLSEPLLYPSYYFKKYRSDYYARLDNVRVKGDWEGWNKYYLQGIVSTASDSLARAKEVETLETNCNNVIRASNLAAKEDALLLLAHLFQNPVITISDAATWTGKAYNTAKVLVDGFVKLKILTAEDDRKRNKRYEFSRYIDALNKDFFI